MTSAILFKLAETYPEVLTEPQKILGPNTLNVLEFWRFLDTLSKQEREEMEECYFTLDYNVRLSAIDAAWNAADEVVGREFSLAAWYTAYNVATGWVVFGWATVELIGDVDNKVAYDLIMSHKNS